MKPTKILIAIQARSTSERLPGKCFMQMGSKTMLEHVLFAADECALHVNRHNAKKNITTKVALLIPEGDPIEKQFKLKTDIVTGPEHNVLQRYQTAAVLYDADYIVRVTGDCPLLGSPIITKHITAGIMNRYDYISNAYEDRTSIDGVDCEFMSKKFLDYIYENAKTAYDQEHVTTYGKKHPPRWAVMGIIEERLGLFEDIKLSVDTAEDFERIKKKIEFIEEFHKKAVQDFGAHNVHRY